MLKNYELFLKKRLNKLQQTLKQKRVGGLLVSTPSNLTYLTGIYPFSGTGREAYLLITPQSAVALVSPLRIQQFNLITHLEVFPFLSKNTLADVTVRDVKLSSRLQIEANDLRVAELDQLKTKLRHKIDTTKNDLILEQRLTKDDGEITFIKHACEITAKTWRTVQPKIKTGMSERQVAQMIIASMIEFGAGGTPKGFNPIVASGSNSAIPHHVTSSRLIQDNDVILVDFGCTINGYASDFSRTFCLGRAKDRFNKIERVVREAHGAATETLSKKTRPAKVDRIAREVIDKAGFGDMFIHTTGHGLGLDVHEPPSVYVSSKDNKMECGTVITVEPGIYLDGEFGYRHEDTILITKDGYENLTELT